MNKREIIEEAGECPKCGRNDTLGFVKEKDTLFLVCKYCHSYEEVDDNKLDDDEIII